MHVNQSPWRPHEDHPLRRPLQLARPLADPESLPPCTADYNSGDGYASYTKADGSGWTSSGSGSGNK